MKLSDIRKEYKKGTLSEETLVKSPFDLFANWMKDALDFCTTEPTAMTLSTVDENGQPNARIVLLKDYTENGFVFFTNYSSQKGHEIELNPKACLSFFWPELERQIKIQGTITKIEEAQSQEYFYSRPIGSQIGAIISNQSQVIPNREFLLSKYKELEHSPEKIKKPDLWGGYCLTPNAMEFWQGGEFRIHDRFRFQNIENNWKIDRLSP